MATQLEQLRAAVVAQIVEIEARPAILDEISNELIEVNAEIQSLAAINPRSKVEDFLVLQLGQRRTALAAQIAEMAARPQMLDDLQAELISIDVKRASLDDGETSLLPPSVKAVFEGDSITTGGYPATAMTYAPPGPIYTTSVIATSGFLAQQLDSGYSTRAGLAFDGTKTMNILCVMAGTNDGAPALPMEIYRNLRSIMRKAHTTGYQRRLIGTLPSRNDGASAFDAITLPLNVALRAMYNSDLEAHAVFDFGADPLFDTASDASNLTYYNTDKLHPKPAGQTVLGNILGPILATQIQTVGVLIAAPLSWSPFDLTANNISLSNANRTATRTTATAVDAQAKAFNGTKIGKIYWEVLIDSAAGVNLGVCNRTYEQYLHAGSKTLLNNIDAIGISNAGDAQYNGGAALGSLGVLQAEDVIQSCLDMTTKRWWVRRNSGSWNGNPSADPAIGVGGIDVSGLGVGPIYPVAQLSVQGGKVTSRFASIELAGPIPAGFTAFG